MILEKGTRIKSNFHTEEVINIYGTIEGYQENNGILAEGYFVRFDDCPGIDIFMSIHAINDLYEVIEKEVNGGNEGQED